MISFLKEKMIRLPLTDKVYEQLGITERTGFKSDFDRVGEEIKKRLEGTDILYNKCYSDKKTIVVRVTTKRPYIDLILESATSNEGMFGFAFALNEKDKEKYLPIFKGIGLDIDPEEYHKVVCSYRMDSDYYPDYYELSGDIFESL